MMDGTMGVKYQNLAVSIMNMLKDSNHRMKEEEFGELVDQLFE
jgi:hypothetical protein